MAQRERITKLNNLSCDMFLMSDKENGNIASISMASFYHAYMSRYILN